MLVYGDPQFDCQLGELARSLHSQLSAPVSFDEFRSILIRAGQLEQALADSKVSSPSALLHASSLVEDLAAQFYDHWKRAGNGRSSAILPGDSSKISDAIQALATEIDVGLTVKVPEGFEFYSLFPEQYCLSAERWCADNASSLGRAVVVGVRSIGTTLSSLVAAVLRAHHWSVLRLTVRPFGHPFTRGCDAFGNLASYSRALVVDEGPGLSGSSMASVADALAAAGARSICLFPGHPGLPGHQASPSVLRVWKTLPRYTSPATELVWDGKSLEESLAASSSSLVRCSIRPVLVDVGAGQWREHTGVPVGAWPEVAPAFESAKLLAKFPSQTILWKFAGLGSWKHPPSSAAAVGGVRPFSGAATLEALKASEDFHTGWSSDIAAPEDGRIPSRNEIRRCALQPVAHLLGYAAFPWLTGTRPAPGRQVPEVLETLASYLVQTVNGPLPFGTHQAAVQRLGDMLYRNTRQALGEALADRTAAFAQRARSQAPGPTYSDGRMGPWEWIFTSQGQIKTDATGHTVDHTLVGAQSILWDLGAVLAEWQLPNDQALWLSEQVSQRLGVELDSLDFYHLSWCAFRLGLLTMAVEGGLSPADQHRATGRIAELKRCLTQALRADEAPVLSRLLHQA